MRSYINDIDKKNEIRLLFKHPLYKEKVILIVEGQTDVRLFRGLFDNDRVKIETIDGKKNLVVVMKELVNEFPQQILGICDADFDHLVGKAEERKEYSVYVTDEHDAEVMMLNSPSLDSFVMEYASIDNSAVIRTDLLNNVFEAAFTIGLLRWINTEEGLNINFKGLNFNIFVDVDKLDISLDLESLIEELIKRSTNKDSTVSKDYLVEKIDIYRDQQACKLQVCSGHDLINIIAIVFRQRWASLDLNVDQKKVGTSLRIGFQGSYFSETKLFRNIESVLRSFGLELQL